MKKKIKRLFINLGVAVASLMICFLLSEIFLRVFYRDKIVLYPRFHTSAQYGEFRIRRMRPNITFWHTSIDGSWKFKINKQGFRGNNDFIYDKKPGTLRILVLGDSNTQGFEVRQDYTYSSILEKYLNSHGVNAEVYNTGIAGYSTAEELIFLENEGINYKPDIVILGLFTNDLEDNIKSNLFVLNNDELINVNKVYLPGVKITNIIYSLPFTKWLSQYSFFYSYLFNSLWESAKGLLYKKKRGELATEYAIPIGEITDYQCRLETKLIERIYGFCKANNIKFIILNIPLQRLQINSGSSFKISSSDCDILIDGNSIVSDFSHVVELHVPHGQHHISEFTHLFLGKNIANIIIENIKNN